MSELLLLIGGDHPGAPVAWARVDAQGRVMQRGDASQVPPPATAPARTVLVVPGADVRLARLELPARSEAQARAGAEAMMNATLAAEDSIHYAVGRAQDAAGTRLGAAISEPRLVQWLARCRELGADPHLVTLDCCVWPANENEIVIALTAHRAIVAGRELGGFSIEPGLLAPLVSRWLTETDAGGKRIVVEGGDATQLRQVLRRDVEQRERGDPVDALARGAVAMGAYVPNLRQGAFAVAGREGQPLKMWRFAALLLAAALMLQVGSLLVSGLRDRQAAERIMAKAETDFRAARPDVRRVVNLRAQVTALANAIDQSANHPAIVTSAPLIEGLRQQPLARIDEVRHEAPSRTVRIVVSAPQAAQLEALVAHLRERGHQVESRSVQPRDGRYVAEFTMEAP